MESLTRNITARRRAATSPGAHLRLSAHSAFRLPRLLQRAVASALANDCPNVAQSAAYSSIVALFPALIVVAAVIGYLPDTAPLHAQLTAVLDRIFPPEISLLLQGYFVSTPATPTTARGVLVALVLTISGASGVIVTLMEGLRRARSLPANCWTFWRRRARALLLVPLSLVPLAVASTLVVFGHLITVWVLSHAPSGARVPVYFAALLVRWTVALTASVGLIALLYHMGTPERQPWRRTFPGAIMATVTWFLTTLGFGWYVTRFANYSQVYGSLGAGIALLFWLYIVCFSVLCGAEFNAQFYPDANPPLPAITPLDDSNPHDPASA